MNNLEVQNKILILVKDRINIFFPVISSTINQLFGVFISDNQNLVNIITCKVHNRDISGQKLLNKHIFILVFDQPWQQDPPSLS